MHRNNALDCRFSEKVVSRSQEVIRGQKSRKRSNIEHKCCFKGILVFYINSDKLILLINEYLIINVDLDRGKTSCAWWRAMRSRFTRTRRAPKAARANHKSRSVSIYEYQKILKNRLIKSCSFKTPMEFPEILPVFFESFINFQTFFLQKLPLKFIA